MQRLVIFLLMWFLPIQFGLAATADVLGHAGGCHSHVAAMHGHDADVGAYESPQPPTPTSSHGDCGACHFFHSLALAVPSLAYAIPVDVSAFVALPLCVPLLKAAYVRPERPKWIALV
jgi:hypothetical protein